VKRRQHSLSVECLLLNVSKLSIDDLGELGHARWVNVAIALVVNHALSIVLVLDLHACVSADVNVGAEVLSRLESLADAHEQVECAVCLGLAVGEASGLLLGGGWGELVVHTVALALREEESGEGAGHQRLALVLGVLCPVRHFNEY
jgi:hypothetical protein